MTTSILSAKFNLKLTTLRPTTKEFDTVWTEVLSNLKASVEAALNGETKAHMISAVIRRPGELRTPLFRIGYGKKNYWFEHGFHGRNEGLDLVEHRDIIAWLVSEEAIGLLKVAFQKKFEAEQKKGRLGHTVRKANTTIGIKTVAFEPKAKKSYAYEAANDAA